MNIEEWQKACEEGWAPRRYDNASREIQRTLKYNSNPNATTRHHLRDIEEQRKYNDEHYEMWGFEVDENGNEHFEYGKYVIFVTNKEHIAIHARSGETRSKISNSVKLTMTEDHRARLSKIAKENMSDERRQAISESTKAAMSSLEIRAKLSRSLRGRKLSEEHKLNISHGCKGRVVSKETRDKISKIHKNKVVSDKTKEKLSVANKKFWESHPEHKESCTSLFKPGDVPWNKGKHLSDDMKKKISDSKLGKKTPFSNEHKENLAKANKLRSAVYKSYKEQHPEISYNDFSKNVWPLIKGTYENEQ